MSCHHAFLIGFLLCALTSCDFKDQEKIDVQRSTPNIFDYLHQKCIPMNSEELARTSLAIKILEIFPAPSSVFESAVYYLGKDKYRQRFPEQPPLCEQVHFYPRIAKVMVEKKAFSSEYLYSVQLRLARKIGPIHPQIVTAVAQTAFYKYPIRQKDKFSGKKDIRGTARMILAEFGEISSPYSEKAIKSISIDSFLGTSAAQLAVASGHPEALKIVEALFLNILKKYPLDPIPYDIRLRLEELIYAIAFGGAEAKKHTQPLNMMFHRTVESWAPPFGMVELNLTLMCYALLHIGGGEPLKADQNNICKNDPEGISGVKLLKNY